MTETYYRVGEHTVHPDEQRSSRKGPEHAGWTQQGGRRPKSHYRDLPWVTRLGQRRDPKWDSFSWLTVRALFESVNDVIGKQARDVVNRRRARWVSALRAAGRDQERTATAHGFPFGPGFVVDRSGESPPFLLVGDTGEADASQYVVVDPLLAVHRSEPESRFMVILSDVIYPAGDVNDYVNGFYIPYRDYPCPIHALPGNHDWYDGLNGFMFHFCDLEPLTQVAYRATSYRPAEMIARVLWRGAGRPNRKLLSAYRLGRTAHKGLPAPVQPSPYHAIDTKHLTIVAIDTGISGEIDAEQGQWLLDVSKSNKKPKILLTGKPIYVDNRYRPGHIDWDPAAWHAGDLEKRRAATTVDMIVRHPDHNYVAAIGGDVHNYQRYPFKVGGRTIQYIVSGGGGAYLSGTHRIPKVDSWGEGGPTEQSFRCYPLRGDCLSYFARRSGPRLFMASIWAGVLLVAAYLLFFRTVPLDTPRREVVAAALGLLAAAGLGAWLAAKAAKWRKAAGGAVVGLVVIAPIAVAVARLVELGRGELWAAAGVALATPVAAILVTVVSYDARRSVPRFLPPVLMAAPIVALALLVAGAPDFRGADAPQQALIWGGAALALAVLGGFFFSLRERVRGARRGLREEPGKHSKRRAAAWSAWSLTIALPVTVVAIWALDDRWDDGQAWIAKSLIVIAGALLFLAVAAWMNKQGDPGASPAVTLLSAFGTAAKVTAGLAAFALLAVLLAAPSDNWVTRVVLDTLAVIAGVVGLAFFTMFAWELRSVPGWIWLVIVAGSVLLLEFGWESAVLYVLLAAVAVILVLWTTRVLKYVGGPLTMMALRSGDLNAQEAVTLVARKSDAVGSEIREAPAYKDVGKKARRIADVIYPAKPGKESIVAKFVAELSDTNEPPFFKHFLRIDVEEDEGNEDKAVLTIRCYGVTGYESASQPPACEDAVSIPLERVTADSR